MSDLEFMVSSATPKTRLLLVDDEASLTELLKMELEVEGYEVDVAADGATGLIRARSEPSPDLIVRTGIFRISAVWTSASASAAAPSPRPS